MKYKNGQIGILTTDLFINYNDSFSLDELEVLTPDDLDEFLNNLKEGFGFFPKGSEFTYNEDEECFMSNKNDILEEDHDKYLKF